MYTLVVTSFLFLFLHILPFSGAIPVSSSSAVVSHEGILSRDNFSNKSTQAHPSVSVKINHEIFDIPESDLFLRLTVTPERIEPQNLEISLEGAKVWIDRKPQLETIPSRGFEWSSTGTWFYIASRTHALTWATTGDVVGGLFIYLSKENRPFVTTFSIFHRPSRQLIGRGAVRRSRPILQPLGGLDQSESISNSSVERT